MVAAFGLARRKALLALVSLSLIPVIAAVKAIASSQEFTELLANAKGRPVIVEYIDADSRGLAAFQKLAKDQEFVGRAYFRKVDMKLNPQTALEQGVQSTPAYQFWLHGQRHHHGQAADASEAMLWKWTRKVVEQADHDQGLTTTPGPAVLVSMITSPAEFARELEQAAGLPLIIEFVSPMCMTCITLAPIVERLAADFAGRALFRKIDSKQTPETASERGVQEMPTFQFWLSGKQLHQLSGLAATEAALLEWTQHAVAEAEKAAAARPKLGPSLNVYKRPCSPRPRLRGTRACKPPAATAAGRDAAEAQQAGTGDVLPVMLSNPCAKVRSRKPGVTEKVLIIGGGPAGMSAAIYAARSNLCPLVLAPAIGGQLMSKGVDVENYPGMPRQNGAKIIAEMKLQAQSFFAEVWDDTVISLNTTARPMIVNTQSHGRMQAHSIILAMGADSRWLHVPGEEEFKGHGVSGCAACDGFLYRGRQCAVIGGGDSAMEEALMLSRICASVTVVHRRDKFRASALLQRRLLENAKVTVRWNSEVLRFAGNVERRGDDDMRALTHLELKSMVSADEASTMLAVDAAFVAVGHEPNTALLTGQVDMDEQGYVATLDRSTRTTAEGLFAAGDVADHVYRQAITSAGAGAMAALDAGRWLAEHPGLEEDAWSLPEDSEEEERHFEI